MGTYIVSLAEKSRTDAKYLIEVGGIYKSYLTLKAMKYSIAAYKRHGVLVKIIKPNRDLGRCK